MGFDSLRLHQEKLSVIRLFSFIALLFLYEIDYYSGTSVRRITFVPDSFMFGNKDIVTCREFLGV